jgi:hypothetical protein
VSLNTLTLTSIPHINHPTKANHLSDFNKPINNTAMAKTGKHDDVKRSVGVGVAAVDDADDVNHVNGGDGKKKRTKPWNKPKVWSKEVRLDHTVYMLCTVTVCY